MLSLFLADEGLQVVTAAHGGEALAALAGGLRPRLMLLDMKMPVCGGAEVLEALSVLPEHRDLPVIVISGSAELEPPVGLPAVQRVLIKPFDLDELLQCILAAIGGATADL